MNILITGISGFVGQYLANEISKNKNAKIFGIGLGIKPFKLFPQLNHKVKMYECDITKPKMVEKVIKTISPDEIYHLAGFSSASGDMKELISKINVQGTLNILAAIKKVKPQAKILLISTSYIYGDTPKPASETTRPSPHGFYAESKFEMEKASLKLYPELNIVITRPVNHTGAGQELGFVVPDFTNQIINNTNGQIYVGNLSAKREFLDVRDVVRAYRLLVKKGIKGEIYNIGCGKPVSIKYLLSTIVKLSGKKIAIKIDEKKFKPVDIKKNTLNGKKITRLGWKPRFSLNETLKSVIKYYKKIR